MLFSPPGVDDNDGMTGAANAEVDKKETPESGVLGAGLGSL
jgi:hypothetical protein